MSLTPADGHNADMSRNVGDRDSQAEDRAAEVDRLLDLVEDDLVRHIEERDELRDRTDALRNREAILDKADAKLRQREAELRQQAAELRQQGAVFQQQAGELRQQDAAVQQQAAEVRQLEAAVAQQAAELRQLEAAISKREAALHQQRGRGGHLGTARRRVEQPRPTANDEQRFTAVRKVAAPNNDPEWTAIRSAADLLGANLMGPGITETVQQQWTHTTDADPEDAEVTEIDDDDVVLPAAAELKRLHELQEENAQLNHVNEALKAAVARFAAGLPDTEQVPDDLDDFR